MENDYTRVCADIAAAMNQASGMAAAVPGVQHAFMMMACNVGVLAQEERKRLFWEMVEGKGPKSQIYAEVHNNRQEQYALPLFAKREGRQSIKDDRLLTMGWYRYLKLNKEYLAGELIDCARAEGLFSYGGGTTRFITQSIITGESESVRAYVHVRYPDFTLERVLYTNLFEGVEKIDLNVVLNSIPPVYVDYEKLEEQFKTFAEFYEGGAFEALKSDHPGNPDWAALAVVGQYLARDELVVSIENFTVHPQTKKPMAFKLSFYRDDEDRLCYTTNPTAYSFLGVQQGYWQNLPFLIRRLIEKVDIKHTGTWSVDYEIRDNDIFPVGAVITLNENPQYLGDIQQP